MNSLSTLYRNEPASILYMDRQADRETNTNTNTNTVDRIPPTHEA